MIDHALATIEAHGKGAEGGLGYVWTVPGWPMRTILWEGQHLERRKRVEAAIKRGNMVLHALPYTLHTATGDVETLACIMWSAYCRCVRPAACRDEALLNICVLRVVVIWTALLLHR
jgi:hypothetical protein